MSSSARAARAYFRVSNQYFEFKINIFDFQSTVSSRRTQVLRWRKTKAETWLLALRILSRTVRHCSRCRSMVANLSFSTARSFWIRYSSRSFVTRRSCSIRSLMSSSTVPLWDTIASSASCRDERYASSLFKRPSSTSSRLLTQPCCSLTSCTHRNASGKIADSCSNLWASSLKLTCAICRLIFRMSWSYISFVKRN